MDEDLSRAGELLENKPFAAEKSRPQPLHQSDIKLDTAFGEDERVTLGEYAAARLEIKDRKLARIVTSETNFTRPIGAEVGQKHRLSHHRAANRAKNLIADRAAAHARFPTRVGCLVDHLAGLRVDLLPRFEHDARDLQIVALNAVFERRDRLSCHNRRRCGCAIPRRLATIRAKTSLLVKIRPAVCAESHSSSYNRLIRLAT